MTWFRMPLLHVGPLRNQLDFCAGTPVLAITILLVAARTIDAHWIFDPALGGDPILSSNCLVLFRTPAFTHDYASMGVTAS